MSQPVVLCTQPLPDPFIGLVSSTAAVRVLDHAPTAEELLAAVADGVDVLCPQLSDTVDARLLDAAGPRLRGVCIYAVGVNSVDVAAATERGIVVANTPGVLTDATADMAMALLLAAARRLVEGDAEVRGGSFTGWEPDYLLGLELRDSLLGIVGFGRIGQAVARRARAFGMRIAYVEGRGGPVPDDLAGAVPMSLERLLAESDVVSLHVPLTDSTRHLIDETALRRMKPTAVLVNTARGAVVDEPVLVRALSEGWIAAAGLDVYEAEPATAPGLTALRNAVLAPHLGSATVRTRAAMAELTARNVLAVIAGDLPEHAVNPQAWRTA